MPVWDPSIFLSVEINLLNHLLHLLVWFEMNRFSKCFIDNVIMIIIFNVCVIVLIYDTSPFSSDNGLVWEINTAASKTSNWVRECFYNLRSFIVFHMIKCYPECNSRYTVLLTLLLMLMVRYIYRCNKQIYTLGDWWTRSHICQSHSNVNLTGVRAVDHCPSESDNVFDKIIDQLKKNNKKVKTLQSFTIFKILYIIINHPHYEFK